MKESVQPEWIHQQTGSQELKAVDVCSVSTQVKKRYSDLPGRRVSTLVDTALYLHYEFIESGVNGKLESLSHILNWR